jgi:putative NIF3 family GTP cyclohydrolase 1 type 2
VRKCAALVAALVTIAPLANAQTTSQAGSTAAQIVALIRERANAKLPNVTVDTFKAGDSTAVVKGIAVTMMATLDVLQRAAARGDNFIITHEPTFYSHRDTLGILEKENDAVYAAKQKFIRDNGLIVWRFHDMPHFRETDLIRAGIIHALGWEKSVDTANAGVFVLRPTTVAALATTIGDKLGAKAIRISGNRQAIVSRVAITQGFPGFAGNRHAIQSGGIDVLVMGEDHEWETIEYAVDAITEGKLKALIVMGHVPSEQAGMEYVAGWLKTFVKGVRIDFIPTADPFRPLR